MDPYTGVPEKAEYIEPTVGNMIEYPLKCPMISCEGAEDSSCYGRIDTENQKNLTGNELFPSLWQELLCYNCETAEDCLAAANAIGRTFGHVIGTETCYYYIMSN